MNGVETLKCKDSQWWHGKFRSCGYRVTIAREAILEVLAKTEKHMSAEDVYMKIHSTYPNIGLTTVYRTLTYFPIWHLYLNWKSVMGAPGTNLPKVPKNQTTIIT